MATASVVAAVLQGQALPGASVLEAVDLEQLLHAVSEEALQDERKLDALFIVLRRLLNVVPNSHRKMHCLHAFTRTVLDQFTLSTAIQFAQELLVMDSSFVHVVVKRFMEDDSPELYLRLLHHYCQHCPRPFLTMIHGYFNTSSKSDAVRLLVIMIQNQLITLSMLANSQLWINVLQYLQACHDPALVSQGGVAMAMLVASAQESYPSHDAYALLRTLLLWEHSPIPVDVNPDHSPSGRIRSSSLPSNAVVWVEPELGSGGCQSRPPSPPEADPFSPGSADNRLRSATLHDVEAPRLRSLPPSHNISQPLPLSTMQAAHRLFHELYAVQPWPLLQYLRSQCSRSEVLAAALRQLLQLPPKIAFNTRLLFDVDAAADASLGSDSLNDVQTSEDDVQKASAAFVETRRAVLSRQTAAEKLHLQLSQWRFSSGISLPDDVAQLRVVAQLLQNELIFLQFQQRVLQRRCSARSAPPALPSEGDAVDRKLAQKVEQQREEIRQLKQKQRQWEQHLLHRLEKLKSERSSVSERIVALEQRSASLDASEARLRSQLGTAHARIGALETELLQARSGAAAASECDASTVRRLTAALARLEQRFLRLTARLAQSGASEKSASAGQAARQVQALQRNEAIEADLRERLAAAEESVQEAKQLLEIQRQMSAAKAEAMQARYMALQQVNTALYTHSLTSKSTQ